jgi:Poly(R)-hydroxyalkanoic acid synthase subunit (PHA_synth_III_E)
MAAEHNDGKPVDPFEAFRGMRDSYLDAMSKVMINAVNSEEYAQATGAMLDGSLMASAPFREALDKATAAALQQASMPSRQEVAALAGRFTNIEMRLDDMEAQLDRIIELCSVAKPTSAGAGSHEKAKAKGKSPQRKNPRKG